MIAIILGSLMSVSSIIALIVMDVKWNLRTVINHQLGKTNESEMLKLLGIKVSEQTVSLTRQNLLAQVFDNTRVELQEMTISQFDFDHTNPVLPSSIKSTSSPAVEHSDKPQYEVNPMGNTTVPDPQPVDTGIDDMLGVSPELKNAQVSSEVYEETIVLTSSSTEPYADTLEEEEQTTVLTGIDDVEGSVIDEETTVLNGGLEVDTSDLNQELGEIENTVSEPHLKSTEGTDSVQKPITDDIASTLATLAPSLPDGVETDLYKLETLFKL